ncbi:hypothetical protein ACETAC_04065 [Aceticella autotrophica]|uniref:Uncharacterized protein n=2 Tax=Aceticella autotrophica TaxID=2755338 RepID=A0A975AX75_9THEO|nr:hypothetical protein ACETAC_04065 [Aceticella autotrophica]
MYHKELMHIMDEDLVPEFSKKSKDLKNENKINYKGIDIIEFYKKEKIKKKSKFNKEDFYKRFLMLNNSIIISRPFDADYSIKQYKVSLFDLSKSMDFEEVFGINLGKKSKDVYQNNISFDKFTIGDIILATSPGFHIQGVIRHAALFDSRRYHGSVDDKCLLTAEPDQGVIYETIRFYQENFSEAWGLYVPKTSLEERIKAVDSVSQYLGKPYLWCAKKRVFDSWYCSMVPWAAYYMSAGLDLDYNGGYWVLPVDIFMCKDTAIFEYSG